MAAVTASTPGSQSSFENSSGSLPIAADPMTGSRYLTFTSSSAPEPDELPFPSGVTRSSGSTIQIGTDLAGAFETKFT